MNLKQFVNSLPHITVEKIIDKVNKYDVISFDIFDTLIKRDIEKESDVFKLTEKLYNKKYKTQLNGFRKIRDEAEQEARDESWREEVVISEIYDKVIGKSVAVSGKEIVITAKEADLLKECEYEIERMVCVPNEEMMLIYQYCFTEGKRILLISDMYWDRTLIEEILHKAHVDDYHALYISSEYGVQKRNGALYKAVLKEEKIKADKVLHIGDNKRADNIAAKLCGISTVAIPKIRNHTRYLQHVNRQDIDASVIWGFINNRVCAITSSLEKTGYEVYGPLLYLFTAWIAKETDSSKTILFFSRDCYLVKKAYELMFNKEAEKAVYFLGSRKSLALPAMRNDASLSHVEKLIKSEPVQMTVNGLLKKLNLKPSDYDNELKKYGLDLDTVIDRGHLSENTAFRMFYQDIESRIHLKACEAAEGFFKYFDSLKCTDEIQVVDIGWRCTMQYCLKNLLSEKYTMKGVYLGVREDAQVLIGNECKGFYLNGVNDFDKRCFLASMTALIEIFFTETNGSVESYDKDGTVQRCVYECKDDESSKKLVEEIQKGALKFVKDFRESPISDLIEISAKHLFDGLQQMGKKPEKTDLDAFANFSFHTGVGVVKTAKPDKLGAYIREPKKFLYDFANSNWKVAFLKQLLKIELPYYRIFSLIYKLKG